MQVNTKKRDWKKMTDEIEYTLCFCLGGDLFFGEKVKGVHEWTKSPFGTGNRVVHNLMGQEFKSMSFFDVDDLHCFFEDRLDAEALRWFPTVYDAKVRDVALPTWASQYRSWRKKLDRP